MFLSGTASVGIFAWKTDDRADQLQIPDSRFEIRGSLDAVGLHKLELAQSLDLDDGCMHT